MSPLRGFGAFLARTLRRFRSFCHARLSLGESCGCNRNRHGTAETLGRSGSAETMAACMIGVWRYLCENCKDGGRLLSLTGSLRLVYLSLTPMPKHRAISVWEGNSS